MSGCYLQRLAHRTFGETRERRKQMLENFDHRLHRGVTCETTAYRTSNVQSRDA